MRKKKEITETIGLPPGTLVHTLEEIIGPIKIQIIDYNNEDYNISEFQKLYDNFEKIKKGIVRWINIESRLPIDLIEKLGNGFNLHPLVLEDIVNPIQRPKFEDYHEYIFIIIKQVLWDEKDEIFMTEQISLILGPNYVISIQERPSNLFNPIIERIQTFKGRVRTMGSDYLLYALLDVIVDNYFILEDKIGEFIEKIEDNLVSDPNIEVLHSIYNLKRQIILLRKSIWPLRAVINSLQRGQSDLISDAMQIYLRDIYDHVFLINDLLENYREIVTGMLDLYLSSVSNKMNEIMKVLTIISTIFIPITFLAGFYGMNFIYMPELHSPLAYPLLIIIMVMISLLLIYFFRRKKWI
ncbi:MAG: magnesium/cobalt transporter CorA [Promethearchaeota archaeon]